jgi:hypothetical protein
VFCNCLKCRKFLEGVYGRENHCCKLIHLINSPGKLLNPMESGLNAQYTAVKDGFKIPLNYLTLVHRGRHTSLGLTVSAVRAGGTRHPTLVG